MSPVLELRHATRTHQTGDVSTPALIDASLELDEGVLAAVMGPSGSGKSTLLSLAGGLDAPTSGEVRVEGAELSRLSATELARLRRKRVGYVFQQFNLIDGLSAIENVSLPLELDGVSRATAHISAADALGKVGLRDLANRFPDALSGGEQQRVAIARAIVGERSLLLADEPTGALDTVTGEGVLRLLREHCDRGGACLVATHDAGLAAWADQVFFLRDGRIVDQVEAPSTPDLLLRSGTR